MKSVRVLLAVGSDGGFSLNWKAEKKMVAQGLTADMFLQLTTTLAHMSVINNNNMSVVHNNIGVVKNGTDQDVEVSNNGTFLNLERGGSPSSKLIITGLSWTYQYLSIDTSITSDQVIL